MVFYLMKIYRNDDPYRHKTPPHTAYVSMQNFATVCHAISEESARTRKSSLKLLLDSGLFALFQEIM